MKRTGLWGVLIVALPWFASPLSAEDKPGTADDPLISVIYKRSLKQYGNLLGSTKSLFEGLPVEIKPGSEGSASKSSRVVFYVTGVDVIGEQRFDNFIRTRSQFGLPISSEPVVEGWKNVGLQLDYVTILPADKKRPKKRPGQAIGIAQGKGGTSSNVLLDNNPNSLVSRAFAQAAGEWQYGILLSAVKTELPPPEILQEVRIRRRDKDGRHLIPASRAAVEQEKIVARFELQNDFPFGMELQARYFALTRSTFGRSTSHYRIDLETGRRSDEPQTWLIGAKSQETHEVVSRFTRDKDVLVGVFATVDVVRFLPPVDAATE